MPKYFKVTLNKQNLEAGVIRHNLSRKELAKELGVSRSYLASIVYGTIEPSAAMRNRFLKYFTEYTFDDLFTLEENPNAKRSPS